MPLHAGVHRGGGKLGWSGQRHVASRVLEVPETSRMVFGLFVGLFQSALGYFGMFLGIFRHVNVVSHKPVQ